METNRGVPDLEEVAKARWEAHDKDRLLPIREDLSKRRICVRSTEASEFERLLGQHITDAEVTYNGVDESRDKLEVLKGILQEMKNAKVIERHSNTRKPILETMVITGSQVAEAYDFSRRAEFEGNPDKYLFESFIDGLVRDFPTSPIVEEKEGRIRGLISKITGHGK